MARAMRASGERNPKAIRVRSRILVVVDSMSPWDRRRSGGLDDGSLGRVLAALGSARSRMQILDDDFDV